MKMIAEAALDDQFNAQMKKIQDAVVQLEKLVPRFKEPETKPVRSQLATLNSAIRDLEKIRSDIFGDA